MAAVDYFLKIKGVEGESAVDGHKNEIDVESFSWGESNSGGHAYGGGGGAGKVVMQDFHFTMRVNKATPKLLLMCASGEHIPEALLTCRKAGGRQEPFLTIKMADLLVSSYQVGGSGGSDIVPIDQISLNYSKIEIAYKMQKADGTVVPAGEAKWDLKAGKKY